MQFKSSFSKKETDITLISIPGLTIKLNKNDDFLKLEAKGGLKRACAPFINNINASFSSYFRICG